MGVAHPAGRGRGCCPPQVQVARLVMEWVLQKQRLRQSLGYKMFLGVNTGETKGGSQTGEKE